MKQCLWFGFFFFFLPSLRAIESISIIGRQEHLGNSISQLAIEDCLALLQQACECEVSFNNPQAQILLQLPDIPKGAEQLASAQAQRLSYPILHAPQHQYRWRSQRQGKQVILSLETPTYQGLAFGLYGLLQEQLWFSFYHPKEILVPRLAFWPLSDEFDWQAQPRFDKKGFHLHTMHPIELAEPLLNHRFPDGMKEIKRYIDWLVRNQQNYFEFNVLNSIDEKHWHSYIKEAVDYAHARGILIGIDLSLHMKQQKAYQLYHNFPKSWRGKRAQIRRRLARFFQNDWDVVNLEFSSTEFTAGNVAKKEALRQYVVNLAERKYGAKVMGREHVVKPEKMMSKAKNWQAQTVQDSQAAKRGVMIHTVMFYGLLDEKAPVYRNENLKHLLDLLKKEQAQRETWYYPESAYWVTFDNSVPMLLLPYLNTRLADIQLVDSLGVSGHLTFSSGLEWGYWLVDWSIARWSWRHEFNGRLAKNTPLQYAADVFKSDAVLPYLEKVLNLQQNYIKDQELIRYMTAMTITDELPMRWHKKMAFQPRPAMRYKDWQHRSTAAQLDSLQMVMDSLQAFAQANDQLVKDLLSQRELLLATQRKAVQEEPRPLLEELVRGLMITGERARHRAWTLSFLKEKRLLRLQGQKVKKSFRSPNLERAEQSREQAQALVQAQEAWYRYGLDHLARKGKNKTAYAFGYLFPVSNLHFWRREEHQVKTGRYGMFRMNIWDVWKIMGLKK